MSHAEGWPEGLTRDAAVAQARQARHQDELVRTGPYTVGSAELAEAVHAVQQAALTGAEPPELPAPAPAQEYVDADAEDFQRRHGYPIDAKRLPAGTYELTGVSAWNQEDPTHPDGVRLRRRGEHLQLTEHEASRLLFIGAISDPDAPEPVTSTDQTRAMAAAVKARDTMLDTLESYREKHRDKLVRNAREREQLRKALTETKKRIAALDVEDEQARALLSCSDEALAGRIGDTFADTLASLNSSIATFRELSV